MSKHASQNDPALGSFIRFVELVAQSARLDYIKHLRVVYGHEHVTDNPPEAGDSGNLLELLPCSLTELSDNYFLCAAICRLTIMEKRVLVLSVLEDKPMEEVSGQLHISLGRAYQLRRRALNKLKVAMEGEHTL